jgi:myo-inositol-1(or 4)-monophosphatase
LVPTRSFERELDVAIEAARGAGAIAAARYQRAGRITRKGDKDVVTEVDHLCEERIISTVRASFPGDPFLAEERGHSDSERPGAPEGGAAASGKVDPEHRIWIVDPIDGTVNYANGIPHFSVSVALAVGGHPHVAVVLDPLRNELFAAIRGRGCRLDGRPVRHVPKETLNDAVVAMALPTRGFAQRAARVRRQIRVSRTMGSAALELAWTANGRFDAYIQLRGLSLWDIAAAGLIAEEAGVLVTDANGGPWFDLTRPSRGSGIVAAPPVHQEALRNLLK